jgi:hypothetical protein
MEGDTRVSDLEEEAGDEEADAGGAEGHVLKEDLPAQEAKLPGHLGEYRGEMF